MRPFRLFVMLVLLTASALALVWLRVQSARTAYRIHDLHADLHRQRYRLWQQEADIAELSEPDRIQRLIDEEDLPLVPPAIAPDTTGPGRPAWETD